MQAYCYFSLFHLMSFSPMHRYFQALECLVRLVSVRRSLFTNDTMRLKYLAHLMTGTKEVMETGKGKYEFCSFYVFALSNLYIMLAAYLAKVILTSF